MRKIVDGAMEVVRGTGTIQTKMKLGYGQYRGMAYAEVVKGSGQGRGNSGFFPWAGLKSRFLILMRIQPILMGKAPFTTVTCPWSTPAELPACGKPMTPSCMPRSWMTRGSIFVKRLYGSPQRSID